MLELAAIAFVEDLVGSNLAQKRVRPLFMHGIADNALVELGASSKMNNARVSAAPSPRGVAGCGSLVGRKLRGDRHTIHARPIRPCSARAWAAHWPSSHQTKGKPSDVPLSPNVDQRDKPSRCSRHGDLTIRGDYCGSAEHNALISQTGLDLRLHARSMARSSMVANILQLGSRLFNLPSRAMLDLRDHRKQPLRHSHSWAQPIRRCARRAPCGHLNLSLRLIRKRHSPRSA